MFVFSACGLERFRNRVAMFSLAWMCALVHPALAQFGVPVTAPALLNTNAASDSGDDSSPSLATDGAGHWVAVWQSKDSLGGTIGTEGDILVARSSDNGATWTAPAALNTNAAGDVAFDSGPRIATDGNGTWLAVWSSEVPGAPFTTESDLLSARSTDNGATWTAPVPVNTDAATDTFRDDRSSVYSDGSGGWVAVWRSWRTDLTNPPEYRVQVARSADGGANWTNPTIVSDTITDTSQMRPAASRGAAGVWVIVWNSTHDGAGGGTSSGGLLFARSTDNGVNWSSPVVLDASTADDSREDVWPRIAADQAGHWIVVWESADSAAGPLGTDSDILVSRSSDNGATWSVPSALNTPANVDADSDIRPTIATDGQGNWVAFWQGAESILGTVTSDAEVRTARSTDKGATWTAPAPFNVDFGVDDRRDSDPVAATDGTGNWVVVWENSPLSSPGTAQDDEIMVAAFSLPADCTMHGSCDDEQFCNGVETCNSGTTLCEPGSPPCTASEVCVEADDRCQPLPVISCALSSAFVEPGSGVTLSLFLDGPVLPLRGYQAQLDIALTSGSGTLSVPCPGGVVINSNDPSYPFLPVTNYPVTNCAAMRLGAASIEAVELPAGAHYLGQYNLVASGDAALGSTFDMSVLPPPESTYLRDLHSQPLAFTIAASCTVTVANCRPYGDIFPPGGDEVLDVDDILMVLNAFSGADYPDADIWPCGGGDGTLDVSDIVAILEAFTGNPFCGEVCEF